MAEGDGFYQRYFGRSQERVQWYFEQAAQNNNHASYLRDALNLIFEAETTPSNLPGTALGKVREAIDSAKLAEKHSIPLASHFIRAAEIKRGELETKLDMMAKEQAERARLITGSSENQT